MNKPKQMPDNFIDNASSYISAIGIPCEPTGPRSISFPSGVSPSLFALLMKLASENDVRFLGIVRYLGMNDNLELTAIFEPR